MKEDDELSVSEVCPGVGKGAEESSETVAAASIFESTVTGASLAAAAEDEEDSEDEENEENEEDEEEEDEDIFWQIEIPFSFF